MRLAMKLTQMMRKSSGKDDKISEESVILLK